MDPDRLDPFVGRGTVNLVGKDRHVVSSFCAALGELPDDRFYPAEPRMIRRDNVSDPQEPSSHAEPTEL